MRESKGTVILDPMMIEVTVDGCLIELHSLGQDDGILYMGLEEFRMIARAIDAHFAKLDDGGANG
jgi:hypothetical protein